jgi:hypothetical protein
MLPGKLIVVLRFVSWFIDPQNENMNAQDHGGHLNGPEFLLLIDIYPPSAWSLHHIDVAADLSAGHLLRL